MRSLSCSSLSRHLVLALGLAATVGCAADDTLVAGRAEQAVSAKAPGACVEDRISPAGVVEERYTRSWESGRMIREEYGFPDLTFADENAWLNPYVRTFAYDAEGRTLKSTTDNGADGTVDENEEYTYGAGGRLEREEHMSAWSHDKTLWTFDAAGNQLRREWFSADGDNQVTTTTYQDGVKTHEKVENSGVLESTETWTYNAAKAVTSQVLVRAGSGFSSESRDETTYTYTPAGLLDTQTFRNDWNGDGAFDRSVTTKYDSAGRELEVASDQDMDGTPDSRQRYSYDADGRTLSQKNTNGDETIVYEDLVNTYDEQGRLRKAIWYPSQWQNNKRAEITVWGPFGITEKTSTTGDATNSRTIISYNALGNVVSEGTDWDGDGQLDNSVVRTFDAFGNMLTQKTDWNSDNIWDEQTAYSYDCFP